MTCDQALDIADAEGLVDITAERLESARTHALQCDRCRDAFQAAGHLATRFAAFAEPALPRDFSGDIMGRVRAIAVERELVRVETPVRSSLAAHPYFAASSGFVMVAALGLVLVRYADTIASWSTGQLTLMRGMTVDLGGPLQLPLELAPIVALLLLFAVLGLPLRSAAPPKS